MKLVSWVLHEMRMQWKNGLYIVYLVVNLFYLLILGYIPMAYRGFVSEVIVITDPTFLGMIFVGCILLMEKNQGIPKGIGVSPLGSQGYILGKVLSLLVVTVLTSCTLLIAGGIAITWIKLVDIILSSALFTLFGILIGSMAKNINHFIFLIVGASIPFVFPVLIYCLLPQLDVFTLLPMYGTVRMFFDRPSMSMTFDLLSLSVWIGILYSATKKVVEKRIFIN